MTPLKAYEITENNEGYGCIVFASNSAAARREGASELDTDWENVDSCRRIPALDCHAPGAVSPMILLEHGWWFECNHCGRRISEDMAEELEVDGLDPADYQPRPAGQRGIYCSATCEAITLAEQRANAEAVDALLECFAAKLPFCTATSCHVYGQKLEPTPRHNGILCSVDFTFPGAKYTGKWIFGETNVWIPPHDHAAFLAAKNSKEQHA